MKLSVAVFLALISMALAHRCPPRGSYKMASPRSDCGYIQCRNGSGCWVNCPDGYYFIEEEQCCVPRSKKRTSGKSNNKSSSGGKRPQNGGGGGGGSSGDGNSGSEEWDYHWRR